MAAANVVSPGHSFIPPLAAVCSISGLLLVTAGAAVVVENNMVGKALAEELHGIYDFQQGSTTSQRSRMSASVENGG